MGEPKKVILTCAQPTGVLTMGNYLGAVKNWASMLGSYQCFFGVVDQHAITTKYVPANLRKNTLSCVAQYIACGLDPKQANLFIQSHVTGHTELAWLLSCLTPIGELQRMTQFKEKALKGEGGTAGLLTYPILQAADILIYGASHVPVGHDQLQVRGSIF